MNNLDEMVREGGRVEVFADLDTDGFRASLYMPSGPRGGMDGVMVVLPESARKEPMDALPKGASAAGDTPEQAIARLRVMIENMEVWKP